METKILRDIGLTDNEIRIYLELIRAKEALASQLADRANVNRTLTYQILHKLLNRGLISYVIKNNVKYFKAGHPNKLLDYVKEKELNIKNMIPQLVGLSTSVKTQHSVELYEGREGLKTILNDVIRTKPKEWLDFTSGKTKEILPYFMDHWEKARAKAGIKAKIIFNDDKFGRQRSKEIIKFGLTETRFFPKGFKSPSHIYVYGNKIAIMLWSKDFPFAILVQNIEIAARFREFFNWFWKISKP